MIGWITNNELTECGKKQSWSNLRYYPSICLAGLRKTTKTVRIAGVRAEIWIRHLPNVRQEYEPLDHDVRTFLLSSTQNWHLALRLVIEKVPVSNPARWDYPDWYSLWLSVNPWGECWNRNIKLSMTRFVSQLTIISTFHSPLRSLTEDPSLQSYSLYVFSSVSCQYFTGVLVTWYAVENGI